MSKKLAFQEMNQPPNQQYSDEHLITYVAKHFLHSALNRKYYFHIVQTQLYSPTKAAD